MTAQINSREAARRYQQEAQVLWEEMDRWLEEHPQATLKEIEQHIRPLRRRLMAKMVELQLLKRGAGASSEAPLCPHCGQEMEYKGIRDKSTVGLELEGELPLAYYHCPHCGEGFSPPQEATGPEESTLE